MSKSPAQNPHLPVPPGRGTGLNPANRFDRIAVELDPETVAEDRAEGRRPETMLVEDRTQSIISRNSSPDIPFDVSVNPYRGCEHGCAYCYARPTHEYLGYSVGLEFETRIIVKRDAPKLLERELSHPKWVPKPVAMSGVTDPYQPIERDLRITRGCLEVCDRYCQPVTIVTKNALVARDCDLFERMATWKGISIALSITTLDSDLARRLEPRTASPRARLNTVAAIAATGAPVGIMIAPIIPGLNDTEIPAIIEQGIQAGAQWFATIPLRLPHGVKDILIDWLDREEPGKKARILERIRSLRGGRLNDSQFGTRLTGEGIWAEQLANMKKLAFQKLGFRERHPVLNSAAFRPPGGRQLDLFG